MNFQRVSRSTEEVHPHVINVLVPSTRPMSFHTKRNVFIFRPNFPLNPSRLISFRHILTGIFLRLKLIDQALERLTQLAIQNFNRKVFSNRISKIFQVKFLIEKLPNPSSSSSRISTRSSSEIYF